MAVEGIMNMNDMAEGMQCIDHPYRSNNSGGGICASCLQEKLGKLVSSSFPLLRSSISSSSENNSPIRSKPPISTIAAAAANSSSSSNSAAAARDVPFLLGIVTKKKNKRVTTTVENASSSSSSSAENVVFKRSKSTASGVNHRRGGGRFWSFLQLSSTSSSFSSSESKASSKSITARVSKPEISVSEEVDDEASFDRKVSRSRSVGCGSRSFSGDFFERISTGFGDCTLRRAESQRESHARGMKERVRCGGIFGGFILTSSSTSSEWDVKNRPLTNGRAKSWGWAFASPIRAFAKPVGPTNGKRDIIRQASEKSTSTAVTLTAIPSLLSARG